MDRVIEGASPYVIATAFIPTTITNLARGEAFGSH